MTTLKVTASIGEEEHKEQQTIHVVIQTEVRDVAGALPALADDVVARALASYRASETA